MDKITLLITGASGTIGAALVSSRLPNIAALFPSRKEMDITKPESVTNYFFKHNINAIIHCAAMTDVRRCEDNPAEAILTNILGTGNVVCAAMNANARLVYLSTDYVYPCTAGPYSENDVTAPFTVYGWTKLGGECAVKTMKNHCIIRTSLLDPKKIVFDSAPEDAYISKIPLDELVRAIYFLLESEFVGIINIGRKRASMYDVYKKYRPSLKPISIKDMPASALRAPDSSLDISLWELMQKNPQNSLSKK